MLPCRSIKDKKSTYIRDFTYYHSTDDPINVAEILKMNMNNTQEFNMDSKFEAILEVQEPISDIQSCKLQQ
jgi:hypothetical protein